MEHISEIASWDPAQGKDLSALAVRQGGKMICFSVDVGEPNMLGWLMGKYQDYKPIFRFGIFVEWVKI
jgi:hypothetical protein